MTAFVAMGLLTVLAGQAEPAPQQVFALVVAHNGSIDPELSDLHYADDDGARFFEIFSSIQGAQIELLSQFDRETQEQFSHLQSFAKPPTRDSLVQAMERLNTAMQNAKRQGVRTVFYFYFAGHGGVGADREGYLHLAAGRLSRSDLYQQVIATSTADVNHIIIDACNSYFLVKQRGGKLTPDQTAQLVNSFLQQESLKRYPNTGVFVSTASQDETHEWSKIRSGIFSHQLLSALSGAGDINGDGLVDYHEAEAFIAAANLEVRDSRARLSVYARSPAAHSQAPLLDLRRFRRVTDAQSRPATGHVAGFLKLPQALTGHYYLEDDRGVRFAEFHKSSEQPYRIVLLDRPFYYLRSSETEYLLQMQSPGDIDLDPALAKQQETSERGTIEHSFRQDLYRVPFGRAFVAGFAAAKMQPSNTAVITQRAPDTETPLLATASFWKWTSGGLAVVLLAGGAGALLQSQMLGQRIREGDGMTMREAVELQQQQGLFLALGVGALVGGGVLTSAAVVLFFADAVE